MATNQSYPKYVEWLNAEDMHLASKQWLSDLRFIKDEQHFFENLIKSYTLQLIDSKNFTKSKTLVDALNKLQKKNKSIINSIKIHENELEIMVDAKDEPQKEATYKNKHRELIIEVSNYLKDYKTLKIELFNILKIILKTKKQKYLLE